MLSKFTLFCVVATAAAAGEPRRVVIVDIDGVRWDTFREVYLERRLPNFERILGSAADGAGFGSAAVFEDANTVLPTVTMAAQASIFTGVYPGKHGIPGNAWFDQASATVVDYMTPVSVSCVYGYEILMAGCGGGMANKQLESPTIYEIAGRAGKSSTVVFSQYYRGATWPVLPSLDDAMAFLGESGTSDPDYGAFDTRMMDHAIESLRAHGLPDVLTVYFSGTDSIGHAEGIAAQFFYFQNVADPQFGRLLDELESQDPDWMAHTLFVMTSDHGRTELQTHPEDENLADWIGHDLARVSGPSGARLVGNGGMAYVYMPSESQVMDAAYEIISDPMLEPLLESLLARASPGEGYHLVQRGRDLTRLLSLDQMLLNALDSIRTSDIILLLKEGHYFGNSGHGSEHGSIFPGDLGVPLILAQGGVVPMRSEATLSTTQVAATIAAYLGIPADGL